MFAAVRNAARCVHMSAAKYTNRPAAENANASQPQKASPSAALQLGATATRSRSTNHTHTRGMTTKTPLTPASTHPSTASFLREPANPSRRPMASLGLGAATGIAPPTAGAPPHPAPAAAEPPADGVAPPEPTAPCGAPAAAVASVMMPPSFLRAQPVKAAPPRLDAPRRPSARNAS